MKNKKEDKGFLKSLINDYKIVISSEDTFEEKLSFKANKINAFIIMLVYSIILISFTISIVFFTQLRELVPGYSSSDLLNRAIYLTEKTDSLEQQIALNNKFYQSIEDVLSGKTEDFVPKEVLEADTNYNNFDIKTINPNIQDSILRSYVDNEDKFNLTKNELVIENKMFFTPIMGEITQGFNSKDNHYALDISADIGTPVKSILEGKIIFSEWSVDTGYVIIIDHGQDIISVYKHNSKALKKQNDFVQAGEVIAYSGNQGNLSTGPHLHFELWKNGTPINPQPLLNFN
ncbi:MAG: M23 family metallopeptidase [Flavobacteriaceae bacterium]|nr:peptidase M23 [Flavobacteriaceae bacterium]RCL68454.1 MAG: M23 family peptidase [Bacteroidota bacterium]